MKTNLLQCRRSGLSEGHHHSKPLQSQRPSACCRVPGEGRGFRPMANGHRMAEAGMDLWRPSSPRWTDDLEVILSSLLWWWHCLGTVKGTQAKGRWELDSWCLHSSPYKAPPASIPAWGKDVQKIPLPFPVCFLLIGMGDLCEKGVT